MRKRITTETTSAINLTMNTDVECFDDRYEVEVQSSNFKVWNEGKDLFCSVSILIDLIDNEDPRNIATISVEEEKINLLSLSRQLDYRYRDSYITLESIVAESEESKERMLDVMTRWLDINVKIEGV